MVTIVGRIMGLKYENSTTCIYLNLQEEENRAISEERTTGVYRWSNIQCIVN